MNELVIIGDNRQAVTSSRKVAEVFEKRPSDVNKAIENLIKDIELSQMAKNTHCVKVGSELFYENYFTTPESNGRKYKEYLMSRDGFTLLAMGFTGKKAMKFKLEFLNEFNRMEEEIIRLEQSQKELYDIATSDEDLKEREIKADKEKYKLQNIGTVLRNLKYTELENEVDKIIKHHEELPLKDRYKPDRKLNNTEYKQKVREVIIRKIDENRKTADDSLYNTVAISLMGRLKGDILETTNRSYGQIRSNLERSIKELEEKWEIPIDKYVELCYHGMSNNYMYEDNKRTDAYNIWIRKFPELSLRGQMVGMEVDFEKPVEMFIGYSCLDKFDIQNFNKATIDQVFRIFDADDNVVKAVHTHKVESVDSYEDGKIYIYIRNI